MGDCKHRSKSLPARKRKAVQELHNRKASVAQALTGEGTALPVMEDCAVPGSFIALTCVPQCWGSSAAASAHAVRVPKQVQACSPQGLVEPASQVHLGLQKRGSRHCPAWSTPQRTLRRTQ